MKGFLWLLAAVALQGATAVGLHGSHPPVVFSPQALADASKQQYLVRFDAAGSQQQRHAAAADSGTSLLSYLSGHSYIIFGTARQAQKLQQQAGVLWLGVLEGDMKVHANIPGTVSRRSEHHQRRRKLLADMRHEEGNQSSARNLHDHAMMHVDKAFPAKLLLHLVEALDNETVFALSASWTITMAASMEPPPVFSRTEFDPDDRLRVRLPSEEALAQAVRFLSHQPGVFVVERDLPRRLLNRWARGITQDGVDDPNYTQRWPTMASKYDLQGQGQVVGVADSGLDFQNCMFVDPDRPNGPTTVIADGCNFEASVDRDHRKVIQYVATYDTDFTDDSKGHGTHVAGSVAGKAAVEGESSWYNGMAPEAKLAFFDIGKTGGGLSPASIYSTILPYAYYAGARIHSDSWGGDDNTYTSNSQETDRYMWENKDMLVIVAAGNSGVLGKRSVGEPATFKNGISVGAGVNSKANSEEWKSRDWKSEGFYKNSIASFSSQGPTYDGRINPTLIAVGAAIVSANVGDKINCRAAISDQLKADWGTSMAAPVLAGSMALVRQYLVEGWYPKGKKTSADIIKHPSASLMKALAITGAVKMTGVYANKEAGGTTLADLPIPNNFEGYGRLHLENSLYFIGDSVRTAIWMDQNKKDYEFTASFQTRTELFCLKPSPSSIPRSRDVHVTLVWTDYPGELPRAAFAEQIILVNDLNLKVEAVVPGQRIPEILNRQDPVEQIVLPKDALDGEYRVTVTAAKIVEGPQPYSLVVSGSDVYMGACEKIEELLSWRTGPYSKCSNACGDNVFPSPIQVRAVTCISSFGGKTSNAKCTADSNAGKKPANQTACNEQSCADTKYEWDVSTWGPCSAPCEGGSTTRTVQCRSIAQDVLHRILGTDADCLGQSKPTEREECNPGACVATNGFVYKSGPWSGCSVLCGTGTKSRIVVCMSGEVKVTSKECVENNVIKPPETSECNVCTCPTPPAACPEGAVSKDLNWELGDWQQCTKGCGGGKQTRILKCRSSLGHFEPNENCDQSTRPSTSNDCNTMDCFAQKDSNFEWQVGQWGRCDELKGIQERWVVCRRTSGQYEPEDSQYSKCESYVSRKPIVWRSCLFGQTVTRADDKYEWFADRWGDCSKWCGTGQRKRLAVCTAPAGKVGSPSDCKLADRPEQTTPCTIEATCQQDQWMAGEWEGCDVDVNPCVGGEHRRIFCISAKTGNKNQDISSCGSKSAVTVPETTRTKCSCCDKKCNYLPGACDGINDGTKACDQVPGERSIAECTCPGGTPASGEACTYPQLKCVSCRLGFQLFANECSRELCPEEDTWPATIAGKIVNKQCPNGQTGFFERRCSDVGEWGEIVKTCRFVFPCFAEAGWAETQPGRTAVSKDCPAGQIGKKTRACDGDGVWGTTVDACYSTSGSCSDGEQNQQESGVDCGGPCPKACGYCDTVNCGNNGACDRGSKKCICNLGYVGISCASKENLCVSLEVDCGAQGNCLPEKGTCTCTGGFSGERCRTPPTPTCFDNQKNGDEAGVDCGGPCSKLCKGFEWFPQPFTDCSKTCNGGTRNRDVYCHNLDTGENVAHTNCASLHPSETFRLCNPDPCPTYYWKSVPNAGGCSVKCGEGSQFFKVGCFSDLGDKPVDPSRCDFGVKPPESEACILPPCGPDTFNWEIGPWQACSRPCGQGKEIRVVKCLNADQTVVEDWNCYDEPDVVDEPDYSDDYNYFFDDRKPLQIQACNVVPCTEYTWAPCSIWSECTAVCGGGDGMLGTQERQVFCRDDQDVISDPSLCDPTTRPEDFLSVCNPVKCTTYNWMADAPWGECVNGKRSRSFHCHEADGALAINQDCRDKAGPMPATSKACMPYTCDELAPPGQPGGVVNEAPAACISKVAVAMIAACLVGLA